MDGVRPGARDASAGCNTELTQCAASRFSVEPSARQRLAADYAPIVYLPDAAELCRRGGNSFAPIPVEAVLDNPDVTLRKLSDAGFARPAPSGADLYQAGGATYFDAYIDLPGTPQNPGCGYEVDALRYAAGLPNTAYARIAVDEEQDVLYLQYWLFYYFNDWNNKHEADWEMVQLRFDASSPAEALIQGPSSIGLSQHRTGEVADWSDSKLQREGSHPVVYVALGSHANYFGPGLFAGRGESGRGLGCDDTSASGRRLALQATLLPDTVSGASDPFAWVTYKGYWGEAGGPGSQGSTAPATKQTWLKPGNWQARLHASSTALPSGSGIGPDAARAYCDLISFGSSILVPIYRDLPPLSLLGLGVVSAGLLGSFATTGYLVSGLQSTRTGRRRCSVLRAAAETYRRHTEVFLTIGLLAFPLGLFSFGLLSPLSDLARLVSGMRLLGDLPLYVAKALAFGGLEAAASSLLVVAATVMAVAATGDVARVRGTRSAAGWAGRLAAAVLARVAAVLMVGGLCLSVVGIPLALRQAVRWAFLEEAVLVGGESWRSAFAASAAVASRGPYRVAGVMLLLGAGALLVAPASGIVLLVTLKSLPIAYVNIAASLLYAVLIPFFALARCRLYIVMAGVAD